MTAIAVFRQSHSVHMLADGAVYGPGVVSHPTTKIWLLPHLSAAFALRGCAVLSPLMANALGSAAKTYDELKACVGHVVRAHFSHFEPMLQGNPEPKVFDLVVGGISEASGPDSYALYSGGLDGGKPCTVEDCSAVYLAPVSAEMRDDIHAVLGRRRNADAIDVVADGVRLIEIQRKHWASVMATMPQDAPLRHVKTDPDGFIQLASIGSDGATTRIVRRWD